MDLLQDTARIDENIGLVRELDSITVPNFELPFSLRLVPDGRLYGMLQFYKLGTLVLPLDVLHVIKDLLR